MSYTKQDRVSLEWLTMALYVQSLHTGLTAAHAAWRRAETQNTQRTAPLRI